MIFGTVRSGAAYLWGSLALATAEGWRPMGAAHQPPRVSVEIQVGIQVLPPSFEIDQS